MILWLKFEGDKFFPCFNFEINKKKIDAGNKHFIWGALVA